MNQARLLALGVAPGLQHAVDMARDAGTALHRQAGRLVEHEHLVVLVQQHGRQQVVVAAVADGLLRQRPGGWPRANGGTRTT